MNSFSRGWSFLKQAWQMALKDRDLIKPSIYSLFAGFLVSLLFIPLLAGGWFLFGGESSTVGQVVMFVLGAVMIFVQYTVGYVFSAMTVYLIYGFLSEGDGRMDKAWAVVKRDFLDLLSLAGASTGVNLLKGFVKGKGKSGARNALAGLIDTVWTEAAFLILPAMVIEDLNLKDELETRRHDHQEQPAAGGSQHGRGESGQRVDRLPARAAGHRLGRGQCLRHHLHNRCRERGWDDQRDRAGCHHRRLVHHGRHGDHFLHLDCLPHLPVPVGA